MIALQAAGKKISVETKISESMQLYGDRRAIKQIVINLLSNAVKFTPDCGRLDIGARRTDGQVQIAVRDPGVGIAAEDLPHVFDEFRQIGQGQAKYEGTGLGLPLAKRFVEMHGGGMWAESEPGRGSTFTFTLPQPVVRHPSDPAR